MDFVTFVQILQTFATGAAGCLAMAKAIKAWETRKAKRTPEVQQRCLKEECLRLRQSAPLFINGDKEEILRAIDVLKVQDRARAKEIAAISASIGEFEGRLERAGI